jgi:hypothetical protein
MFVFGRAKVRGIIGITDFMTAKRMLRGYFRV